MKRKSKNVLNYIVIKHGFPHKRARATIRKVQDMMSLPAIIGISAGAAGVVAFSRKKQPQSLLKKIGVFFLASGIAAFENGFHRRLQGIDDRHLGVRPIVTRRVYLAPDAMKHKLVINLTISQQRLGILPLNVRIEPGVI